MVLICALFFVMWQTLQVWGMLNVVQSHSYALSSLHSTLLIPIMFLARVETHRFEKIGFLFVAVGVLLILGDRESYRIDNVKITRSGPVY